MTSESDEDNNKSTTKNDKTKDETQSSTSKNESHNSFGYYLERTAYGVLSSAILTVPNIHSDNTTTSNIVQANFGKSLTTSCAVEHQHNLAANSSLNNDNISDQLKNDIRSSKFANNTQIN